MYYDNEDAGDLGSSNAAGASEALSEEQEAEVMEFLESSGQGYYDDSEDLADDFRADHPKAWGWDEGVFESALAEFNRG